MFEEIGQLAAGDNSFQLAIRRNNWIQFLSAACMGFVQKGRPVLDRKSFGYRHYVGAHNVTNEQNLERVHRVLAAQVESAAADFLGQNGTLEALAR